MRVILLLLIVCSTTIHSTHHIEQLIKLSSLPLAWATVIPILFFSKRSLDYFLSQDLEEENEERIVDRVVRGENVAFSR